MYQTSFVYYVFYKEEAKQAVLQKVSAEFDKQRVNPADAGGSIDLTLSELTGDEVESNLLAEIKHTMPKLTVVNF